MPQPGSSTLPAHTPRPKPERFFAWAFRSFALLDDFRQKHPVWTRLLISTPLSAALLWMIYAHLPHFELTRVGLAIDWFLKAGIGLVISEGFLRGVVPVMRYAGQGSSLRQLGLHLVFTDNRSYCRVVSKLVADHPKNERIRVICISGKYLFVEEKTLAGELTPLHDHARRGLLDVLMPRSDAETPTIRARFDTYNEDFRRVHHYHSIDALVAEAVKSKAELAMNTRNRIIEHDILCLWRVVMLKEFCIVQTYFPNPHGNGSNEAPIFVFQRHPTDDNSGYYATFANMFSLVEKYAARPKPGSPPPSVPPSAPPPPVPMSPPPAGPVRSILS